MPSHYTVKYTDFGPRYKFETFEEERARHEREYREKYLRVRQTEQQDLIEDLQKKLNKLLGEPAKEHKIKRSIAGSTWNISLDDKTKIQKVILKANIYDM